MVIKRHLFYSCPKVGRKWQTILTRSVIQIVDFSLNVKMRAMAKQVGLVLRTIEIISMI